MFASCCLIRHERNSLAETSRSFGEFEEVDDESHEEEEDPDEVLFNSLAAEVRHDPKCMELIGTLLAYARQQVQENMNAIVSNLTFLRSSDAQVGGLPSLPLLEVDLLWPGSGYNAVACGGNYEVLCLLEKQGLVKVGDICGSSGGACSALLALADPESSSKKLLFGYMVYAKWFAESWDPQIWQAASIWSHIYDDAIKDDAAFEQVRTRAYCAVAAGKTFKNVVMHNFTSRDQILAAFQASGEASVTGILRGVEIDGVSDKIGDCSDLGNCAPFPGRQRKVLYHHAYYGYALKCTMETIEILFKKGVDQTILLMKSKDLRVRSVNTYTKGMELAINGEGGMFVAHGSECVKYPQKTLIRDKATFLRVDSGKEACFPPQSSRDIV